MTPWGMKARYGFGAARIPLAPANGPRRRRTLSLGEGLATRRRDGSDTSVLNTLRRASPVFLLVLALTVLFSALVGAPREESAIQIVPFAVLETPTPPIEVARAEQLLNQYEQTILTAFREVEDAIVATYTYQAEYEARRRQVEAAINAANLSWVRYEGGMTSYLEVLDLQRSEFSSQLQASESRQLHLTSIVRLYQALGGGWE